ncbi:hydroxyisourate hydrolase [Hyphococcus sp.]|uniref:hydroxyisourate hydrolase n=1 Tax=Hyphococcus sp. TaxID=2038636 RepID=UPI003750AF9F
MGKLTTHILDTSAGKPAANVQVELYEIVQTEAGRTERGRRLNTATTNKDGRCDAPLLEGAAFKQGQYELEFALGDYFAKSGAALTDPKFIDAVLIRFGVSDADTHYHVPLLASPFGYSTYRGS